MSILDRSSHSLTYAIHVLHKKWLTHILLFGRLELLLLSWLNILNKDWLLLLNINWLPVLDLTWLNVLNILHLSWLLHKGDLLLGMGLLVIYELLTLDLDFSQSLFLKMLRDTADCYTDANAAKQSW